MKIEYALHDIESNDKVFKKTLLDVLEYPIQQISVLPQHLKDPNFSFSNINNLIRKIMRGELTKSQLNESQKEFIFSNNGLFWTRELSKDNPNCTLANESVHILNNNNENGGIVVGHTIQEQINSKCDGKVWAIDSGMSDAFGKKGDSKIQVLEILNNKKVNIL